MSDYRVFDSLQDVILVIEENGFVVYGNQAACNLFEISSRRLSARKPLQQFVTFKESLFSEEQSLSEVVDATQVKEIEFSTSSGKSGWIQVSLQRQPMFFDVQPEAEQRWILYVRDVTLEKALHDKYRAELDKKELVIRDLETARSELLDYSRNLEKMVDARTAELRAANQLLKTILDSLGQGMLVFDKNGRCLPVFSAVTRTMLHEDPANRLVTEVLCLNENACRAFDNWRVAAFEEMLDFNDLMPLAPDRAERADERDIKFTYHPMRDPEQKITGIVLVATDRTGESRALKAAQKERETVRRIVQVARHKDSFQYFVADARRLLQSIIGGSDANLFYGAANEGHISSLLSSLHTLKGGAASFALTELADQAHLLEGELQTKDVESATFGQRLKTNAETILAQLESDLRALEEILGALENVNLGETIEVPTATLKAWSKALSRAKSLSEVEQMNRKMQRLVFERPIGPLVSHVSSAMQDLAASSGKKLAPIEMTGAELNVPVDYLRPLLNSLVHAFRNSVDHGIEKPSDRLAHGKSEAGKIEIHFQLTDSEFNRTLQMTIKDDGEGIDTEAVRQKLLEQGLYQFKDASEPQLQQAILRDDLSTRSEVTATSGRGVGMAAVDAEARKLGGEVEVISVRGKGTTLIISIPLAPFEDSMQIAS